MKANPPPEYRTTAQREQDDLIRSVRAVAFALRQSELSPKDAAIMLYSLTDLPYHPRVWRRHD